MKELNIKSLEVEGVVPNDYPDFVDAFISYAEYTDGTELTEIELEELNDQHPDIAQQLAAETFF